MYRLVVKEGISGSVQSSLFLGMRPPIIFFLWDLDIDECSTQSSPCNENADCTNNEGSYSCSCKRGFSGDGITCVGQYFRKCSLEFYM